MDNMNAATIAAQVLDELRSNDVPDGSVLSNFGVASLVCDRLAAAGLLIDTGDAVLFDADMCVERVEGGNLISSSWGPDGPYGFADYTVQARPRWGEPVEFKVVRNNDVPVPTVGEPVRMLIMRGVRPRQPEQRRPLVDLTKLGERG